MENSRNKLFIRPKWHTFLSSVRISHCTALHPAQAIIPPSGVFRLHVLPTWSSLGRIPTVKLAVVISWCLCLSTLYFKEWPPQDNGSHNKHFSGPKRGHKRPFMWEEKSYHRGMHIHRTQHRLWLQKSAIGLRICHLWVGWKRLVQYKRQQNTKEHSPRGSRTLDLRLTDQKSSQEENWVEAFQAERSANTNPPGTGEYWHVAVSSGLGAVGLEQRGCTL